MQSITEKLFTDIYDRRDHDLNEDEIQLAVWWADNKIRDMKKKWAMMCKRIEETSPKSLGSSFSEFMSENIKPEVLEMMFWGKSMSKCCELDIGSHSASIDTDEITLATHYKCSKSYWYDLWSIQRAYKLQAWNINGF